MKFMDQVNQTEVKPDHVEVFWLGQAGFLIKTQDGKQIVIDPYFSDCVFRLNPQEGYGFKRMMPPVCDAKDLEIDVLLISHEHNDHFDVDAIGDLVKLKTEVYTNCVVADSMEQMGFDMKKVHRMEKGTPVELPGCRILPVDCDHGELSPEALGFLLDFGFIRIYYAGDTAWTKERLKVPLQIQPEAAILPINGAYGNLDSEAAAAYARELNCRVCIPCHFWTFPLHRGEPQELIELMKEVPDCRLVMLCQGESCTLGLDLLSK